MDRRTLGAIAGIAAPVLFVAVFTIEGWLRPDYDARRMFVSELALGPRGFVQIANFVAAGMLTMLFARGVATEFPAARAAILALYLIGIGLVGAGAFVMDPLMTPVRELSWHAILHRVFGAPVLYGMPISAFLFARQFSRDPRWRPLVPWTVAMGIVTIVMTFVLLIVVALQRTGVTTNLWGGAIQRTHHIVYFVWQAAVAVRLLRPRATPAQAAVTAVPPAGHAGNA